MLVEDTKAVRCRYKGGRIMCRYPACIYTKAKALLSSSNSSILHPNIYYLYLLLSSYSVLPNASLYLNRSYPIRAKMQYLE
jgi:hypothetical protein